MKNKWFFIDINLVLFSVTPELDQYIIAVAQ